MTIDTDNINELVDKYYECETTLDEENLLTDYFNSDNVAPELLYLKPQFVFYSQSKAEVLDEKFDEKIREILYNQPQKIVARPKAKNYWYYSAAAVIILGIGISYLLGGSKIRVTGNDGMNEADFAYEQTISALMFISVKMDNAEDQLGKISVMNKGMESFNHFEKLKYLEQIINKEESK